MSEKIRSDDAWSDYLYWQTQDKKPLKRINLLIKDTERNGALTGIGEPEALKGNLHGEYSRRINEKDCLVYHLEDNRIYIVSCKGHYDDTLKAKDFIGIALFQRAVINYLRLFFPFNTFKRKKYSANCL